MITMDKFTQFKFFDIYQPRYHDKKVLLACHKVGDHNKIIFSQAPSMGSQPYYVSGKAIKKFKKESNGSLMCYAVPLDELQPLEISINSEHELW